MKTLGTILIDDEGTPYIAWKIGVALVNESTIVNRPPDSIISTIGQLLEEDMNRAVANGADSRSMPDNLVELAIWLQG